MHRPNVIGQQFRISKKEAAIVLDLAQMATDIAGLLDPTPISDGMGLILAVSRRNVTDAVISAVGLIPFIGDLAKAGKLGKYVQTIENAARLAARSPEFAKHIKPVVERTIAAIDFLPPAADWTRRLKAAVQPLARSTGAVTRGAKRIDISATFKFSGPRQKGKWTVREAEGTLGVPSRVVNPSSATARRKLSPGTGDDAGHLIAGRFGAGATQNLGLQNWVANRSGSWYKMEDDWAAKLEAGYGIRVKISEFSYLGESRGAWRRVEWTEVWPTGRISVHSLDFANTTSVNSRKATGWQSPFPEGHTASILQLPLH